MILQSPATSPSRTALGHSRRRTSIISGLSPRADMWTNAGEGEEPRGVHCRRNLGRRFYFHVTFQKLSWVLSGAPVEVGRRVGAGLSVWGAGWASFDLVSLDLRWVSATFPPLATVRPTLAWWLGHRQRARAGARASPHPVCSVYGAARVQSALPDAARCRQQAATRHEPGSRAGTTRLRPSHHRTI